MDPAQLEQAMAALLRNARQAMGGVGSVHLATGLLQARPYRPGGLPGLRKSRVWFEVRDHGPGIPVALRERIFEPLFSTRPESGCCGLGLALVRTVVDGHDGSIQVDSAADGGAVVRILIPV
jgi:signal transduction histidine kinase